MESKNNVQIHSANLIGKCIESEYGAGQVIAETSQWIIHNNCLGGSQQEFALLRTDDEYHIIENTNKHSSKCG